MTTCAPWFDVGRRTASVRADPLLGNNLALCVWGTGSLRTIDARRPHLVLTRGAGHALRVSIPFDGGGNHYATAYRPDRVGD